MSFENGKEKRDRRGRDVPLPLLPLIVETSCTNTRGAFLSDISISATRIESRGWSRATGNKRRHWRMASVILREQFPTRPLLSNFIPPRVEK